MSVAPFADQADFVNFIAEVDKPMAPKAQRLPEEPSIVDDDPWEAALEEPIVQEAFRRHGIPMQEPYDLSQHRALSPASSGKGANGLT